MKEQDILIQFREKVSAEIRIENEGVQRYRVFTPFHFEDGDHLAIILKRNGTSWLLSDEGHTFMHLTYDIDERVLERGTRQRIIGNALSSYGVEDQNGELVLRVDPYDVLLEVGPCLKVNLCRRGLGLPILWRRTLTVRGLDIGHIYIFG